jgi:hypothetical protein
MNTTDANEDHRQEDWFVRAAGVVGDFGHPLYAEERQRDVWNEASAFGFQLLLWLTLLAAAITVWLVGKPAVPYTLGLVGLTGAASWATVWYASRLGVDLSASNWISGPRVAGATALLVAFFAGVFRAVSSELDESVSAGVITGGVIGAALALFAYMHTKTRRTRGDDDQQDTA